MLLFYKLYALVLAATVMAGPGVVIYRKKDLALTACEGLLKKNVLYFGKKDTVGYCNVRLQQALGSMAHCLKSMPTDVGVEAFIESCSPYNLTIQQFDEAYNNATKYLVKNTTGYPGFNLTKPFNLPVKLNQKKLNGAYDSVTGRYYNYNRANYYGWALMIYWLVLILFAGVVRLVRAIAPKAVNSLNGKFSNTYRKYVTMPALGREKVVTRGRFLKFIEFVIPTRIETIYLVAWFAMALAFNTANFHHDTPNYYWKTRAAEMGRKVGDRSGIIVLYVIPQMVLFAGRNNFLQWVSGWPYARFNTIHKWMARLTFILSMVHTVGLIINGIGVGKYYDRNSRGYIRWGWVSTIASLIMCIHSLSLIRKHYYELFVLSHNVLAALFIAGVWIHVEDDNFQQMMYATTAVWALDKLVRILRMSYFGIRTADVQLIAGETLRVKVSRPSMWNPHPLSFGYIYFFKKSCFWQSHPFTIVDSVVEKNVLSFYIKVKGGMSNQLYQYLSKQPDQRASIKCSVEGPYGPNSSLQHYQTVSYLSGGNGIPGPFYSATHLAKKGTGQNLKLYWVIRHWKTIEWFYEELKTLEGLKVETVVYVTQFNTPLDESFIERFEDGDNSLDGKSSGKNSDSEVEKEINEENAARLMSRLPFIEFRAGRPDLESIIKSDITESQGATAFVACGHDVFVDQTRKHVVNNLVNGKRVDFYDTMQVW